MSRISGSVRYDADDNGVGEMPTPNMRVTAEWPNGLVTTAVTDGAGAFRFDTVLAGEYRLFIAARDLPPNTAAVVGELAVLFDGAPFEAADFTLQPAPSGRIAQLIALIRARHAAVVEAYCWDESVLETLATEALSMCRFGGDGELTPAEVSDLGVILAVVLWRRVEEAAALGFDFEADDAAYKRSQLAAQATAMRIRAEDRAWRLGICGFAAPAVELGMMPAFGRVDGGWS